MKSLTEYDYDLPRHLIAQHPTRRRGSSRLLLVDRRTGALEDLQIADLPDVLGATDSLVLNDTRVIPARLRGIRDTSGGKWEGLFLQLASADQWQILSRTRGKLRVGETVSIFDPGGSHRYTLQFQKKLDGGMWLVQPDSKDHFLKLLDTSGSVPLPPYIRGGNMQEQDRETYQTVYAEHPGAVAAPTAGLHFSEDLLNRIQLRGTTISKVTLHVGIGTFRPIEVENLDAHLMHSEWGRIDASTVAELSLTKDQGGRIVSIGTTSVRVLETAAASGTLTAWQGNTDLFIKPGYRFKAVDALLTNFHLPKSTLLILVRTFGGDELIKEAYAKAIERHYRFYSYGDAMFIR